MIVIAIINMATIAVLMGLALDMIRTIAKRSLVERERAAALLLPSAKRATFAQAIVFVKSILY